MYLTRLFNFALLSAILLFSIAATTKAEQNSIDFRQLKAFAAFANAAYQTGPDISRLGQSTDYQLSHHGTVAELEISYYLLTSEQNKTQLIAVRGTANIENALLDVALKLVPDEHTGIRLHNGFSRAAGKIFREIKPLLKADYTINTTGHSLGGAVALVLAMYLDVADFQIGQVVTFGQPKVTNIGGAAKFDQLNIIRVVTPQDLVPLVPPLDPLDINDLDIYWHAGKEVLLLEDRDFAILEGINSMLRATRFTQQPLSENNLQDHQMSLYMERLDKRINEAREVPFKNSFNLFNLFGGEPQ
jgi:predicted lipase